MPPAKSSVSLALADLPDVTTTAGRDDPGQRLRAERARDQRNPDPADPAAPAGDRVALAVRRRCGAGGQPGGARDHRARRRRQARPRPRACAGNCCARPGNTRWYSVNGRWRHKVAGARPADRSRGRSMSRADNPANAGPPLPRRALSLGGHRRRQRRAVEPAIPCRLVCRGGAAGCAGQARRDAGQDDLPAGRDREAVRQGAVRRRGRAGDRLRPYSRAALGQPAGRGRHDRDPGRCRRGAAGSMRWSAPTGRRSRCAGTAASAAPGRAVGVAWLGIDCEPAHPRRSRWPRPMWRGRAARSKSGSRWPGSPPARRPMSPSPRSTRRC